MSQNYNTVAVEFANRVLFQTTSIMGLPRRTCKKGLCKKTFIRLKSLAKFTSKESS